MLTTGYSRTRLCYIPFAFKSFLVQKFYQEDRSHVPIAEMSNDYCAVVAEVGVRDDVCCVCDPCEKSLISFVCLSVDE